MSFFPMPLDKRSDPKIRNENLPKPTKRKSHTIKDVRKNKIRHVFEMKHKVKDVVKALHRFQTERPFDTLGSFVTEEFLAYCSVNNIFSSPFEAKCFISAFRSEILEEYAGITKESN